MFATLGATYIKRVASLIFPQSLPAPKRDRNTEKRTNWYWSTRTLCKQCFCLTLCNIYVQVPKKETSFPTWPAWLLANKDLSHDRFPVWAQNLLGSTATSDQDLVQDSWCSDLETGLIAISPQQFGMQNKAKSHTAKTMHLRNSSSDKTHQTCKSEAKYYDRNQTVAFLHVLTMDFWSKGQSFNAAVVKLGKHWHWPLPKSY